MAPVDNPFSPHEFFKFTAAERVAPLMNVDASSESQDVAHDPEAFADTPTLPLSPHPLELINGIDRLDEAGRDVTFRVNEAPGTTVTQDP